MGINPSMEPYWCGSSPFDGSQNAMQPLFLKQHPVHVYTLVIIGVAVYIVFRVFTHSTVGKNLTDFLRRRMERSGMVEPVSVEELMVASGGYGVVRAEICSDSPLVGCTLAKSGLRAKDITVLVVRRDSEPIANPHADTRIQTGDQLLCFGNLDQMRKEFAGDESQCPERAG